MNLKGIIAISGRPGIFKVITQGKNSVIVESMLDKKRFPAHATEKISTLEDISICYGITKERVRQIEKHAIRKLRKALVFAGIKHLDH